MSLRRRSKKKIWKRDNYTCQYCAKTVIDFNNRRRVQPSFAASVDHIKPKSKSGTNRKSNLITACRQCNLLLEDQFDNFTDKKEYLDNYYSNYHATTKREKIGRWEKRVDYFQKIKKRIV